MVRQRTQQENVIPIKFVVALFLNADAVSNKISVAVRNWNSALRSFILGI